jgi:hypothetical protein
LPGSQEEIFDRKSREKILTLESGAAVSFQLNELFGMLEYMETRVEVL